MSKIKLTGESSGYVEISAGNAAGNNTLEAPTSGTRLVAHEGSQDVTLNGNLTVNGVLSYEDTTNIDSVGLITARNGLHVTGGHIDSVGVITARDGLHVTGGHIGVGVTPESWSTNLRAVQIGRQACVTGQTDANIIEISANAYHNSGWKYIESDTATSYYQYQGDHVFSSAASGTADAAISFTERLRITSAGKVGINTASPRAVLDIEGNAENATLMLHSNDANANLQFSDNTGGARILNYGGDLAFRTGTNAHVFGTGDSEALRITSAGNVGIGLTNPTESKIVISHTQTSTVKHLAIKDSTNNWVRQLGVDSSNNFGIFSGDTEHLRITSAGNIGIGTDTPYANNSFNSLSIGGSGKYGLIELNKSDGVAGSWIDTYGTNGDGNLRFTTAGTSGAITFWTGGSFTERARITSAGTLIIDAGGDAQDIQIISHSGGSGHGKIYLRGNASNESSSIQLNHYGHADYHISAGRAANGLFSITRTDGGTDGIIMNANGNIGIKNTGTSSKLHIGDIVGSVSNDIDTTHTSLIIKQTNNDNKSGLYIERSGERKGYYMWMNPGGGAGDGLTFTRNYDGTKSNALILDRDANLTAGGHIYPSSNNTYDLGSTTNAWRNVYTNDLHLSNMSGGGNDVDGTTGDWTIQEGEENLYIINNRSGKKYKFNLQEVN